MVLGDFNVIKKKGKSLEEWLDGKLIKMNSMFVAIRLTLMILDSWETFSLGVT